MYSKLAIPANEIIRNMKTDKCYTMSRSRSSKKHHNFSNKYTQLLGERGYSGIGKDGYFKKFYSYGVVGHCCIFVQYHLIQGGYPELVPKKGYIWNTNRYASWLKTEPNIKGIGKVDWTSDLKKAQAAAKAGKVVVTFKGTKGKTSYSHTCTLLEIKDGYVKTVDGNISGKFEGKKINNGVVKKRKASSYRWGFAILPIPTVAKKTTTATAKKTTTTTTKKTTTAKKAPYVVGGKYTLKENMNIRASHSSKSKKLGVKKKGKVITAKQVHKTSNGSYWIRYKSDPAKWICAKTPKKTYMK